MVGLNSVAFQSRYLQHMTAGINQVIKACQVLVEAKLNLSEREFADLCRDLNLSKRTQQRFLRIGEYEPFLEEALHDRLPHAWGTLYELTCLDKDKFNSALVGGQICSRITRRAVRKLLNVTGTGASQSKLVAKTPTSTQPIVGREVVTLSIDKDNYDEELVDMILEEVNDVVRFIQRYSQSVIRLTDHNAREGIQNDVKALHAVESVRSNLPINEFKALNKMAKLVRNYCKHQLLMSSDIEKKLYREGRSNASWANEELMKCEPSRECVEYAFQYLGIDLDIDQSMFDSAQVDRLIEKLKLASSMKQRFSF